MFSVKEFKAFTKKLSGKDSEKDGKASNANENGQRRTRVGPDRVSSATDGSGPVRGPKLSTHRSGCSEDFKTFLSEDDEEVVAFESPLSGDFSFNNSAAWTRSSDWEPEGKRKGNEKNNLQF